MSATRNVVHLHTVEQIRRIETAYAKTHPQISLMQLAGEAAARSAAAMVQSGGRILVLAGHGNNGGDAWVAARALQAAWHAVTVLSLAEPKAAEARKARDEFVDQRGEIVDGWPEGRRFDVIVDGLLGIGLSRPPEGRIAELIDRANASGIAILALDVPSGLDADSGLALGKSIRATQTITFIGAKAGLFTGDGPDHAGKVHVEALNIDDETLASEAVLLTPEYVQPLIPRRLNNSHKGTNGSVGIVGGATGMAGAAALASYSALLLGAGKVFHGSLCEALEAFDPRHPEIMLRKPRDLVDAKDLDALVIGPGMGTGDAAKNLLASALKLPIPLVIDADALNLVATGRALQNALPKREAATLLTPHPGEAARLLGVETRAIAENRVGSAIELARRFHATTVLKGAGTVIAFPGGTWCINSTGNPGLASGGTGDVLAGMLGALIAQGMPAADAARLGVCLHGAAADACVADGIGPIGLTASDVAGAARTLINAWANQAAGQLSRS
jgi:ADP-dependent NAD(P)H-hydrate dehydratase / NAD(P)H-hydrate epimerase